MSPSLSKQYAEYQRNSRCPHCNKFLWWSRDYVNGKEVKPLRFTPPKDPAAVAECPKCHGRWFIYEQARTIEVREGSREDEVAYQDEILLDNSRGASPMKRKQTITREWTETLEIELENSETSEVTAKIGGDVASLQAMAQNALKSTYRLSQTETKTFSDELEFEVPAGVRRRVILTFKRVWQHGVLELRSKEGEPATEVPYKLVVGLKFDMAFEDDGDG